MATGAWHYQQAEQLIKDGRVLDGEGADMTAVFTLAQVHATLALAAATALSQFGEFPTTDCEAWLEAASGSPYRPTS